MEMYLLALCYWLLSQVDAKFKQIARFPRTNFDMKLVNFLKKEKKNSGTCYSKGFFLFPLYFYCVIVT